MNNFRISWMLSSVAILTMFLAGAAYAHSGGLDSKGCHHDRKNGGYHCHRAQPTESKSSADATTSGVVDQMQKAKTPDTPAPPQTFIGPRGGRYHYSASGKKVYERRR